MEAQAAHLTWRASSEGFRNWSSAEWTSFTGLGADESLGLGWLDVVHPDDRERAVNGWTGGDRDKQANAEFRLFHQPSGSFHRFRHHIVPMRLDREVSGDWFGVSVDVEKAHEMDGQDRLQSDVVHHLRNSFAVIRSIAKRTLANAESLEDFSRDFEGRLEAFSRTQRHIPNSFIHGIELETILRDELQIFEVGDGARITLRGPQVLLSSYIAGRIGLAIHELSTNALKYGALSGESGRIDVSWDLGEENGTRRLDLEWRENTRHDRKPAQKEGFGKELLTRTLRYELDADTKFTLTRNGLHYGLSLPLPP